MRVQDCFDSGAAAALVLKTGGQQRSLRLTDLLRAGPSGRDGLSFEVLAPVEIRARNVSDQWVLGIGLVDPATGAVHVRETAARGGTILLRR